jgi:predicted secreted protein
VPELIAVAPGETFDLRFEAAPTAGYKWSMVGDGAGIVELVGSDFEPSGDAPGAPATQVVRLAAVSAGTITLVFRYGRPWEATSTDERSVEVEVSR